MHVIHGDKLVDGKLTLVIFHFRTQGLHVQQIVQFNLKDVWQKTMIMHVKL